MKATNIDFVSTNGNYDQTQFDSVDESELAELWWYFCKENNLISCEEVEIEEEEEGDCMTVKCLNCGREMPLTRLRHDENNLEGFYINCPHCHALFDIDEESILNQMFIDDIPKMADFKVLSKDEFLQTYSYLTEDEYDATRLYFNWLTTDDSEP